MGTNKNQQSISKFINLAAPENILILLALFLQ